MFVSPMPPPWRLDFIPQDRFDRYLVTLDRYQQEVTKKGIARLTVDELRFYREQYETLLKEWNQNRVRSGRFHLYYQTLKKIQQRLRAPEVRMQFAGERFLTCHHQRMPKGINDVNYERDSKRNCAIVSVAALLGKRVSDIAGYDKHTKKFFCPPEFGINMSYEEQANGMCRYLERIGHAGRLDASHITNTELVSYEESKAAMLSYPVGTQFLVYSTHHLEAHWTYAERWPDGIRFYDYQIDFPEGHEFEYDSSESHKGSESDPEPPSDHSQSESPKPDFSPKETAESGLPSSVPLVLSDSPAGASELVRSPSKQDLASSSGGTLFSIVNEQKERDRGEIERKYPYPVIEYRWNQIYARPFRSGVYCVCS